MKLIVTKGFLARIERVGNRLPDPVFIFVYLTIGLALLSSVLAFIGVSAIHPTKLDASGAPISVSAINLLSPEVIQRFLVEMPQTFTHFYPLGYVLLIMLGAGVAEYSGFLPTAMRAAIRNVPVIFLTPVIAFVGMLTNHAADASYVVFIPLAGVVYAAAGRHPIAGIAAAFAGVAGGFSANISPGQLDALLLGITQEAVRVSDLDPGYLINIAGNTYLIQAMTLIFVPIIWFVTDKIIEPRLGPYRAHGEDVPVANLTEEIDLSAAQKKGLIRAGYAALGVVVLWILLTIGPGTPLFDESACSEAAKLNGDCSIHHELRPFYKSLVAAFFVLFLACGWAYGSAVGTVRDRKDIVQMMTQSMSTVAYYIVVVFAAAHFVAMFEWSNLGLILGINGAEVLKSSYLPMSILMGTVVLLSATLNLLMGSASAKWVLLSPVLVPMLMLIGISPEGATAAYRLGDSATNIVTPIDPGFALVLVFCQRWQKDIGVGSLLSVMIPYSVAMIIASVILIVFWIATGLSLGPDAGISYTLPNQ